MNYFVLFFLEFAVLYFLSRKVTASVYVLFLKLFKSAKFINYLFALLFLPGTVIHELSHYIFAIFLRVKVDDVEFIPEARGNKIKMGSVKLEKTDFVRSFVIGVSPVLVGTIIILLTTSYLIESSQVVSFFFKAISVYLLFTIGNTMFSSKEDMRGVHKVLAVLALIAVTFYYLGISISLTAFFNKFAPMAQKASIYLLFVLAVDMAFLVAFRMLKLKSEI